MRSPRVIRARRAGLLAVAAIAALLGVVGYATHALRRLDLSTVDARFSIRGTQPQPDDIVIIGVDDKTFDALKKQWPFPRRLHARLIDRLREDGAKAIAYDVQFSEESDPVDDEKLVLAVERADHVVLSTTEVNGRGEGNVFGGGGFADELGASEGDTQIQADSDGKLRRFPVEVGGLTSFPVATVEAATGSAVDTGEAGGSFPWNDYRGPPGTFEFVSFAEAMRGKVPASTFRNKIVLVGATSPSLQDYHSTSTTGEDEMPGVEVQANAVWTVEHGFPLQSVPGWLNLALILLLALGAPAVQLRLRPLGAFGVAVAAGLLFALAAQLAFNGGWVLSVAYPLAALALSAVGALAVVALITAYERQQVRDTFARFVPETVVDDVLERTDDDLRLGGVRREGTVMFTDLRGFTSFAEALPPDRVIEVLNHYLSGMSDAIMDHGGTLVAFMGDGIMAVFGAPIEQPDHADRAVAAAAEMLGARLSDFNSWLGEEGLGEGFEMGIGINSGSVMSGQVGSERRIEYTAIGDTTNTAARLEGMTKGTPHQVFVADSTRELLADPGRLEDVDELAVRGRSASVRVWTFRATEEAR